MQGAPDQYGDAAKFNAKDMQRAMQRDKLAESKMRTWVRLIVRRALGRKAPPTSPWGFEVRPTAQEFVSRSAPSRRFRT